MVNVWYYCNKDNTRVGLVPAMSLYLLDITIIAAFQSCHYIAHTMCGSHERTQYNHDLRS